MKSIKNYKNLTESIKNKSIKLLSIVLSDRQLCDLELIINGAFNPLTSFLSKEDYESVLKKMRLKNGKIWPIPIMFDVSKKDIDSKINLNDKIALRDKEGFLIAILKVKEIWKPNKQEEAKLVYGTSDINHSGVKQLFNETKDYYISGPIENAVHPHHYDFQLLRHTPNELKHQFDKMGWKKIVAFQTRNPMHRAHKEIAFKAAIENDANLLIHPVVGQTKEGDVNHYTRVRCYQEILNYFPKGTTTLSLLPLAMRMAGPREALWHALIRKNYGCTHLIVGRDHAGPGNDKNGKPYYGPYDAQELLIKYEDEIGIKMVPFKMMVYVSEKNKYYEINNVPKNCKSLNISGTEFRQKLENGDEIPAWFSYPEVVKQLRTAYPEKTKQGFTLFFTGLSGSGKSTIANGVLSKLLEKGDRKTTLLDGDIVRTHLSSELGFSKEHRDINVKRIGYVASEITKNGGIAICAPIAPFEGPRIENKNLINQFGKYLEIYISTSVEECTRRDTKGLYAKAISGELKGFTGINDPYEIPKNPDLTIDTENMTPEESVQEVVLFLEKQGLIK
ncbi:MAG: adenylyltransferase [Candidatus Marinimicrobia bacterium]|nr:adenylyltransferase [Candidatus Neomarinimicrobiota bacterium]|tara:strand:+ start:1529 stop:3211 length:1683 start_codon:yes stop_codon:yes gene_type:complete